MAFFRLGISGDQVSERLGELDDYEYNVNRVQGPDSDNCGAFCLLLACRRFECWDEEFLEVLNDTFATDVHKNEKRVVNFYNSLKR